MRMNIRSFYFSYTCSCSERCVHCFKCKVCLSTLSNDKFEISSSTICCNKHKREERSTNSETASSISSPSNQSLDDIDAYIPLTPYSILRQPIIKNFSITLDENSTLLIKLESPIKPLLSQALYNRIKAIVRADAGNYGPNPPIQLSYLTQYGYIQPQDLALVRKGMLTEKSIKSHRLISAKVNQLNAIYERTHDILHVAKVFDAPPLACFRLILQARKIHNKDIKVLTGGKLHAFASISKVSEVDKIQLLKGFENDIVTRSDQSDVATRARGFEIEIETILRENGVEFLTQEDLASDVTKQQRLKSKLRRDEKNKEKQVNGAASSSVEMSAEDKAIALDEQIVTPDILVKSKLVINGFPVNFIDCKNDVGGSTKFIDEKTFKQMKKYTVRFGTGAVLYSRGFIEDYEHDYASIGVQVLTRESLVEALSKRLAPDASSNSGSRSFSSQL